LPSSRIPRTPCSASAQSLVSDQGKRIEAAIWTAVNVLEERAALLRRLASRAGIMNRAQAARFLEQADEADEYANLIHRALLSAAEMQSAASKPVKAAWPLALAVAHERQAHGERGAFAFR
jgi:hypothetical protein